MSPDDPDRQVESDLLADRGALPDGLAAWQAQTDEQRRKWIQRFARAERHRPQLEAALAEDPDLIREWANFPPTEQREVLSTLDYLRFWPVKFEMRRAMTAVRRGSEYRRLMEAG